MSGSASMLLDIILPIILLIFSAIGVVLSAASYFRSSRHKKMYREDHVRHLRQVEQELERVRAKLREKIQEQEEQEENSANERRNL